MATSREVESIGQRIKRLRLERGLSQRDVADVGVSYAYISRIEADTRAPSVKAIRKLARRLGATPEYLETGVDLRPDELLELRFAEAELRSRLGETSEADLENSAEALVREAEEVGDAGLAAMARLALARIAANAGRHADAIEQLEAAIRSRSISPIARPRAYAALANSYLAAGRAQEAAATLRQALDETAGSPQEDLPRARFAGMLSEILAKLGDLEQAREVRAAAEATSLADPCTRIRALAALSDAGELEGKPREKLRVLREALTLLEDADDAAALARAQLGFAEEALFGPEPDRAEPHLEAAQLLLAHGTDPSERGSLGALRALFEAHRGNADAAEQLARDAMDVLEHSPSEQATAWLALATAAGKRDDFDSATSAFASAVDRLEAAGQRRKASRACRAWSGLLRRAGRLDEALDVAERAAALATDA